MPEAPPQRQRHLLWRCLWLFLAMAILEVSWLVSLWTTNNSEFSNTDTLMLSSHVALALAFQFAVIMTLGVLLRLFKGIPIAIIGAAFSTFAFYSIILTFIDSFATAPIFYQSVVVLAVFVISALLLVWSLNYQGLVFVAIASGVLIVSSLANFAIAELSGPQHLRGKPVPDGFVKVRFKETPNVYLIAFDALIPGPVAKIVLDVDRPPYIDTIEHLDLRLLRNTFANRVPTNRSLNSILAMDVDWYDATKGREKKLFDTGELPSPLYTIFKENGYSIQFIYSSAYFGPPKKARIDYYGRAVKGGICTHIDDKYALMLFCLKKVTQGWRSFFGVKNAAYPAFLFRRIEKTAKSGRPWLTFAYIHSPGHAPNATNLRTNPQGFDAYRKKFSANSKTAAEYIETLVRLIRENDPGSITLVFGDHGPKISRTLTPEDPSPLTARKVILDRHAVVAALDPKTFCEDEISKAGEPLGLVRLVRLLVKCLAGGEDPIRGGATSDPEFAPYVYE
jgi:hypothetical protein